MTGTHPKRSEVDESSIIRLDLDQIAADEQKALLKNSRGSKMSKRRK
jgi:hypothetical protein